VLADWQMLHCMIALPELSLPGTSCQPKFV
jgi:hypothetical protein